MRSQDTFSVRESASVARAMPGRAESSTSYRYGFNGKEKDDGVKGSGVQYDYGFRIYDARIARFLSVDPLTKSYPMLTPYQFASNRPIDGIDLDGLEYMNRTSMFIYLGDPRLELIDVSDILVRNRSAWNMATFGTTFDLQGTPFDEKSSKFNLSKNSKIKINTLGNYSLKAELWTIDRIKLENYRSGKAHKKNMKSKSKADGLIELTNAIEGTRRLIHLHKNNDAIDYGIESVYATLDAVQLVKAAIAHKILPKSISNNITVLQEITNFIVDGTLPEDNDSKDLARKVGLALFNNKEDVLRGKYSFFKKLNGIGCIGCDGNSSDRVLFPIFEYLPSDDKYTKDAYNAIKNYENRGNYIKGPEIKNP